MRTQGPFLAALVAIVSIFGFTAFSSCDDKHGIMRPEIWEETWVVASKRVVATGVAEQLCYWIKKDDSAMWELQYDGIAGFEYEEGYEWTIEVVATEVLDPPQDASSVDYTLKSVISKVKKDSDVPELNRKYGIVDHPE